MNNVNPSRKWGTMIETMITIRRGEYAGLEAGLLSRAAYDDIGHFMEYRFSDDGYDFLVHPGDRSERWCWYCVRSDEMPK